VVVALLALSLVTATGAGAAPGDIHRIAGVYRQDCGGPDPSADLTGQANTVTLAQNLSGIAVTADGGAVYLGDRAGQRIHRVSGTTVQTVAGDGFASGNRGDGPALQRDINPLALAVSPADGKLYFLDADSSAAPSHLRIRRLDGTPLTGTLSTVVDLPSVPFSSNGWALAADNRGSFYVASAGHVWLVAGGVAVVGLPIVTGDTPALAVDPTGAALYATDSGNFGRANGSVTKIDPNSGNTAWSVSNLSHPTGVALDPSGSRLFLAEGDAGVVRELNPSNGAALQRVAGLTTGPDTNNSSTDDVLATQAALSNLLRIAVDGNDNIVILDGDNCVVRMVEKMPAVPVSTPSTGASPPSTIQTLGSTAPVNNAVVPPPGGAATGAPQGVAAGQGPGGPPGAAVTQTPGQPTALFDPGRGVNIGVGGFVGNAGSFGGIQAPAGAAGVAPPPVSPGAAPIAGAAGAAPVAAGAAVAGVGAAAGLEPRERPAPHYTMVGSERRGPSPITMITGMGIVAAFGCVIAVAVWAENRDEDRVRVQHSTSSSMRPRI
jgi:sugar lactone lactonase YvrE